jgi:hypothetical protein
MYLTLVGALAPGTVLPSNLQDPRAQILGKEFVYRTASTTSFGHLINCFAKHVQVRGFFFLLIDDGDGELLVGPGFVAISLVVVLMRV